LFASAAYIARLGEPSPTGDLRGHEIVGYDAPLAHVPGARWLDDHAEGASIVFRGNSLRAVVDAAVAGLGLTVLPHFLASRTPGLVLLAPEVLGTRTLSVVVHPDLVHGRVPHSSVFSESPRPNSRSRRINTAFRS
jgi:DNA-binding transcriptional LysR family regulator